MQYCAYVILLNFCLPQIDYKFQEGRAFAFLLHFCTPIIWNVAE